jgi:hypothetical protein
MYKIRLTIPLNHGVSRALFLRLCQGDERFRLKKSRDQHCRLPVRLLGREVKSNGELLLAGASVP